MAGRVHGEGKRYAQPGLQVADNAELVIKATRPFALARRRELIAPLDTWELSPSGRVCLDVGASTGASSPTCCSDEARSTSMR